VPPVVRMVPGVKSKGSSSFAICRGVIGLPWCHSGQGRSSSADRASARSAERSRSSPRSLSSKSAPETGSGHGSGSARKAATLGSSESSPTPLWRTENYSAQESGDDGGGHRDWPAGAQAEAQGAIATGRVILYDVARRLLRAARSFRAARWMSSLDGNVGSRSLSACSAPTTGSLAGSRRPTCTRSEAWSQ
jgi:hypothetical protein